MISRRTRKQRDPVLKHGDVFHVYIASDTPQEVCDYLTDLKRHGEFSYEVLKIISHHLQNTAASPSRVQSADKSEQIEQTAQFVKKVEEHTDLVDKVDSSKEEKLNDGLTQIGKSQDSIQRLANPEIVQENPIEALRKQRKAWINKLPNHL